MRKSKELSPEEWYKSELDYVKTLLSESDRGLVLLTACRVEELLEKLHRAHIRSIVQSQEKMIKELFSTHASRSTFSAKIKLAFGFGLVSREDYCDIELLRGLRNDAAHTVADFTFNDPTIKARL